MIQQHVSLKPYNTFGIDVKAESFVSIKTIQDLIAVLKTNSKKLLVIGGGSNMLLTKDIEGLVVHLDLKGIEIGAKSKKTTKVKVAAGENWHDFVLWSLQQNLGGLENLSLIPGNVGTAPIQNIGAYGVELKDTFIECEALNLQTLEIETFVKTDCKFDYRNSIFKSEVKGKYIIISVTFELTHSNHELKTSYGAILSELEKKGIANPSIQDISKAVIAIRQSKLPNPKRLGNSGSFFKNPVVTASKFKKLHSQFPNIPHYPVSEQEIKIPAGWLIETAGFKGKNFGNYGVHKNQALVLVNYGGAKGKDILNLSQTIQKAIDTIFGIPLEAEVNIL
ncbi:UDP-N-acetylmuramate dehydrogenase [Flavobacteriaceae bacterium]|nr:UDP-N-acetylmuramate dehydrogenase [Flavobacteriaceae bacterium]